MEKIFIARVQYSKKGLIRFIGHLDTARLITRALRCSGLPVKFTEGFSPHVKVSFGPPLPLGFTSDCEFFDAVLEDAAAPSEIVEKLQPHFPEGITVEKTAVLTYRASALARIIDRAQYRITLPEKYCLAPEKIEELLAATEESKATALDEKAKMRAHIESVQCADIGEGNCVYDIVLKDVNKGAPSIKKIFALLFGIELFETEGAQMHRLKLYSTRQDL